MTDDNKEFPKPADKMLEKKLPFSPHFLTPAGMLLPKHQQPPPMYGPRGATVPPKFIPKYDNISSQPNYKAPRGGAPRKPFHEHSTEPTLPPRNWDLWCESCDRDFSVKSQLESHKAEHTTCGIDGCTFFSHPSIIAKHVVDQHESGLYEKMKKLESPEDIAQWREQRKKNYPTRANIELKQRAKDARRERGEKLEQPKGKFNRNQEKKKNKPKPRRSKQRQQNHGQERTVNGSGNADQVETDVMNQGIPMFRGIGGMLKEEEEEVETLAAKKTELESEIKKAEQETSNPLLKLIGMYGGSDMSDDDEEEEEVEEQKNVNQVATETTSKSPAKEIQEVPKEEPRAELSAGDPTTTEVSPVEGNKRKRKLEDDAKPVAPSKCPPTKKPLKSGLNYDALRRTKPNTMLFKLLQEEMRHERNVLLQAVRFVVENNFFDGEGL